MKKSIIILFGFILLFSTISHAEMVTSKYGKIDIEQWSLYNNELGNCYESVEDFLKEVDFYVEQISNYLGIDFNTKIKFILTESWRNEADCFNNWIKLSVNLMKFGVPPLAHEITHTMTSFCSYPSFREGLAEYMHHKFSKTPSTSTIGFEVHSLAKYFLSDCDTELIDGIVHGGIQLTYLSGKSVDYFYILSHSFVKYLINTYDVEKFMNFYNNDGHPSYKHYFGVDRDEIKSNWLKFIDQQEVITEEQYLERCKEFLEELKGKSS